MNSNGAGSGNVAFYPVAAEEIPGKRVTAKICELCTRMFFRDKDQKECKACESRLAELKESQPVIAVNNDLRRQPKSELTKMHMRAAQAKRRADTRVALAAMTTTIQ